GDGLPLPHYRHEPWLLPLSLDFTLSHNHVRILAHLGRGRYNFVNLVVVLLWLRIRRNCLWLRACMVGDLKWWAALKWWTWVKSVNRIVARIRTPRDRIVAFLQHD